MNIFAVTSNFENLEHASPIGLATLAKMAFNGLDLAPVWNDLVGRVTDCPTDAAAFLDLATIAHLQGRPTDRAVLQAHALELQRLYRQWSPNVSSDGVRVLALMAPGDFKANIPIEFMLQESNAALDLLYVVPGLPLPSPLPEHDVALVAVAESSDNQAVLREIATLVPSWPRPVVNAPEKIARLTRDGTWELLESAPGVVIPINARIDRKSLEQIAIGDALIEDVLMGSTFPIIVRPLDSHAGEGLRKVDDVSTIDDYLRERTENLFYIAPFVDYSSKDGLFRKYRIALIAGVPYACHMAISRHWMVHYLNADMTTNAMRRAEEERFMADFDSEFAVRHKAALDAIAERTGLDYLPFDCGEMPDGKMLVFETGTNMIVHSMDSPDLFPYKQPQMEKVFGAFLAALRAKSTARR